MVPILANPIPAVMASVIFTPLARTLGLLAALLAAACSPLALVNGFVPTGDLAISRDIAYGAAERHRLDVYRPAGAAGDLPIVVFFYGGSWQGGDRRDYLFAAEALAAQGFLVVLPDYRVHPEVRFPAFMDDAAAALRWARDQSSRFGGDPGRMFVVGHSAGAHIAVLLSLDGRYLAAQGLSPADIRGTIGLAGPYDFLPLSSARLKAVFGQDIGADLAATQPINFVAPDSAAPPMLLASGADDEVVYPRNTVRLARRLRETGGVVEEIHYGGIGHYTILLALARPSRGLAPVLDDAVRFMRAR